MTLYLCHALPSTHLATLSMPISPTLLGLCVCCFLSLEQPLSLHKCRELILIPLNLLRMCGLPRP